MNRVILELLIYCNQTHAGLFVRIYLVLVWKLECVCVFFVLRIKVQGFGSDSHAHLALGIKENGMLNF